MIVDLALNGTGSQLIAQILPMVSKDQGTLLYDAVSSTFGFATRLPTCALSDQKTCRDPEG